MLKIIISFIFYILFIIYFFVGIYGLSLNKAQRLNQIFSLICMGFSIWAFAFSIGNSARSYEEAVIWRRVSSLGWGGIYSLILHFTIVFTKEEQLLKKKWAYVILYFPAIVNVLIFGLFTRIANEQYYLVHTQGGWARIPLNNFGDIFFNVYYLLFSLATILILIRWYFKTNSINEKRHAIYIGNAFLIALFLGTLTDSLVNRFLTYKVPSLAPIFISIPLITIYYVICKYGLLLPKDEEISLGQGMILTVDNRNNLFKYISICFFGGAIYNIFLCLANDAKLELGVILSTALVIIGTFIYLLPSFVKSTKNQENFLILMMSIIMPVIMFLYLDKAISNIVWPIPLFFIMTTTIFNNQRMIKVIGIISVAIGITSWAYLSDMTIALSFTDYMFRMLFYVVGIALIFYIYQIYRQRLKENKRQLGLQKLIAEISTDFVTVSNTNYDSKVTELLKKCGAFMEVDRCFLAMVAEDNLSAAFTQEWVADGVKSVIENYVTINMRNVPWLRSQLSENKIIAVSGIGRLPSQAHLEKEMMLHYNIQAFIYIPIMIKGKVIGILGFDQIRGGKKWHLEDHALFRMLSNILSDAITRLESEKEISFKAYYDSLTGLPNKVLFCNRLEQALSLARRNKNHVGVIFIDLDGFKTINDTLGHDWGDTLLQRVGGKMGESIRKYDTISRTGGDEFLIMIPNISNIKDIEEVVKKMMYCLREPMIIREKEFFMSASFGISIFPKDGDNVEKLIKHADLAMYHAKNNGKNQYAFCTEHMTESLYFNTRIASSLHKALEQNELYLQYQPQVCIKSKEIIGVEALLRWRHPELGDIPPSVFIPVARQTSLIRPIGEWVLDKACKQNKLWQEMGFKPIKMAVNISLEQFHREELTDTIRACLQASKLEPKYLELEIRESTAMTDSNDIRKSLKNIKQLGISIAIDDFGTEYSSLSRIKDLPIDKIKIDMQFVHGISINKKDESIISVIIHLAKCLGLKVSAEGVEKEEQLEFLRCEACDEVQGFYFYKPMSKDEIETKLVQ